MLVEENKKGRHRNENGKKGMRIKATRRRRTTKKKANQSPPKRYKHRGVFKDGKLRGGVEKHVRNAATRITTTASPSILEKNIEAIAREKGNPR